MSIATPRTQPSFLYAILPYLILVLAVLMFYGNVYDNTYLYDDEYLLQKNTFLRDWHMLPRIFTSYATDGAHRAGLFFRPLQIFCYFIVYQICGLSLLGFHFLNVALHAVNACLVYVLGRRSGFNPIAVFLAALVWALHPVHVEAITYMSATADPLYTMFCLLGVIVLWPDFSKQRVWAATGLMILALLSKETAIMFPLLAMSCLYLTNPDRLNPRSYIRLWPLWALAAIYMCGRFVLIHMSFMELLNVDMYSKAYGTHIILRVYTFLATLPAYIGLLVAPHNLHMDRDFPVYMRLMHWQVFAGAAIVLAIIGQIIWGRGRRGVPLSWGFMWAVGAYAPQTGIFMPVNSILLEHWLYLPSIGLFLGIAQTLAEAIHIELWRRVTACAVVLAALVLGTRTYAQNEIWHDPFSFYGNILANGETSVRAHNNLGIAYQDRGDYINAMKQFQQAIKEHDLIPESHQNIASLISRMPGGPNRTDEQIAELNRAIQLDPGFLLAYEGLAGIYAYRGDKEKAAFYKAKADDLREKFVP